ncbi:Helix-turn-helix protein, putative [Entamoeba histolytica HM-1:IMSS-B]|uniref:Helix-turn-helix protein, putative n=6 Tax=Entamoeba histolytica TaxID=5759 RepID=C4MB90_ENTH1|nr:Helix-turn-helix protein, putative [Entamoeba histolytica HM-1:IMSS]EMD48993.1 helixturn-helix protein, putative [Entamoeba histolytica KU27]EMH77469.1 Helix-turn-helix protein, putative [Entamoeba histolytica HM-1:IMSS-B]EMS17414.1 Helix-turn-helix protein [Entamoeba histolytica HM-3:IMSS]ENY65436.1 Helix-turn-helix protein, putative [Entamoeba histolytica HM-1:IMSS-A]GAT99207.1 helix-turn-helix protein putative [Entamoeba histolytica]|eukprot:XP_655832.1 Helix-turn-helix protein, putative [Entamoeba histolytica HM-1:IMSS]
MAFNYGIDTKDIYIGKAQNQKGVTRPVKKPTAGMNSTTSGSDIRSIERKADEGETPLVHKQVSHKVSLEIQRARQEKHLTQKELAQKINEKPQTIADYESGKAIPSQQVLAKLERILGVKLRGLK